MVVLNKWKKKSFSMDRPFKLYLSGGFKNCYTLSKVVTIFRKYNWIKYSKFFDINIKWLSFNKNSLITENVLKLYNQFIHIVIKFFKIITTLILQAISLEQYRITSLKFVILHFLKLKYLRKLNTIFWICLDFFISFLYFLNKIVAYLFWCLMKVAG